MFLLSISFNRTQNEDDTAIRSCQSCFGMLFLQTLSSHSFTPFMPGSPASCQRSSPVGGSTELWRPLRALSLLPPSRGVRNLLLLSDGHIQNAAFTLQLLRDGAQNTRLFTCGLRWERLLHVYLKRPTSPREGLCSCLSWFQPRSQPPHAKSPRAGRRRSLWIFWHKNQTQLGREGENPLFYLNFFERVAPSGTADQPLIKKVNPSVVSGLFLNNHFYVLKKQFTANFCQPSF